MGMVSTAAGQNGDGTGRTRKVGTVLNKCIKYIIMNILLVLVFTTTTTTTTTTRTWCISTSNLVV